MMRRSSSLRSRELNATTSENKIVQFCPLSGRSGDVPSPATGAS